MILALSASAPPVIAQDWGLRDTDERFDAAGIEAEVSGRTLTFYDDGRSKFSAGGAYSYTYSIVNGGGSQFGTWSAEPDGIICISYRNGFSRCDMYVRASGRLVVLTEDGGRFPVRPED
jgi:hypothetical protein